MKISIISLVYNHEKYLHEFFNGILSQKHDFDYELIIGVDKSNDHSKEICLEYQNKFPLNIKVIAHDERVGMFNNFYSVYSACTGQYVAICEGDDYWTDECKLQKQVAILDNNIKAVMCFTDIRVFDNDKQEYFPNWTNNDKEKYTIKDIIKFDSISTCSVIFRNGLMTSFNKAFNNLPMVDWPFYLHLLLHGDAYYLPDITSVYRVSFDSSYSKNSVIEQLIKKHRVYEYLLGQPSFENYRKEIIKAYYISLYAISIRLKKGEIIRVKYMYIILKDVFRHKNIPLFFKTIVRQLK